MIRFSFAEVQRSPRPQREIVLIIDGIGLAKWRFAGFFFGQVEILFDLVRFSLFAEIR